MLIKSRREGNSVDDLTISLWCGGSDDFNNNLEEEPFCGRSQRETGEHTHCAKNFDKSKVGIQKRLTGTILRKSVRAISVIFDTKIHYIIEL